MTPSTPPGGFASLLAWFLGAMAVDVDDPAGARIRAALERLKASERDGRYQGMFLEAVAAAGGDWRAVFARAFPGIGFVARAYAETALRDVYGLWARDDLAGAGRTADQAERSA